MQFSVNKKRKEIRWSKYKFHRGRNIVSMWRLCLRPRTNIPIPLISTFTNATSNYLEAPSTLSIRYGNDRIWRPVIHQPLRQRDPLHRVRIQPDHVVQRGAVGDIVGEFRAADENDRVSGNDVRAVVLYYCWKPVNICTLVAISRFKINAPRGENSQLHFGFCTCNSETKMSIFRSLCSARIGTQRDQNVSVTFQIQFMPFKDKIGQ